VGAGDGVGVGVGIGAYVGAFVDVGGEGGVGPEEAGYDVNVYPGATGMIQTVKITEAAFLVDR